MYRQGQRRLWGYRSLVLYYPISFSNNVHVGLVKQRKWRSSTGRHFVDQLWSEPAYCMQFSVCCSSDWTRPHSLWEGNTCLKWNGLWKNHPLLTFSILQSPSNPWLLLFSFTVCMWKLAQWLSPKGVIWSWPLLAMQSGVLMSGCQ